MSRINCIGRIVRLVSSKINPRNNRRSAKGANHFFWQGRRVGPTVRRSAAALPTVTDRPVDSLKKDTGGSGQAGHFGLIFRSFTDRMFLGVRRGVWGCGNSSPGHRRLRPTSAATTANVTARIIFFRRISGKTGSNAAESYRCPGDMGCLWTGCRKRMMPSCTLRERFHADQNVSQLAAPQAKQRRRFRMTCAPRSKRRACQTEHHSIGGSRQRHLILIVCGCRRDGERDPICRCQINALLQNQTKRRRQPGKDNRAA